MSWIDRLKEFSYTSPSGIRTTFDFENVSQSFEKKTTAFDFPDAEGTFIQDLGHTGRRYPVRLFIWGDDHDQKADAFMLSLEERGAGKMEHPIYGVKTVVPFGIINRRDDLKTAANQSVFQFAFWETTNIIYPSSQTDPASEVIAAVNAYNIASSEQFENNIELDSTVEQVTFQNTYLALLDQATAVLEPIAVTQQDVETQFNAIVDSINSGINILVDDPLTLAFQTSVMIQSPARALTSISARLEAYSNLASQITGTSRIINPDGSEGEPVIADGNIAVTGVDSTNANNFFARDLYASTYSTGSIVSAVNNQFKTKSEALETAERILSDFEELVFWRDANYESLSATSNEPTGVIDTGEAYQQLLNAVALTAGFLVEISFTLKQERSIVLDRARTPLDLEAELYGTVDENLDFLISSNDLSGSEILEIQRGREIVYYI